MTYDDLAVSYFKIAGVSKEFESKAYYQIAYDIWSTLAGQCPDNPEYARRRDMVKPFI